VTELLPAATGGLEGVDARFSRLGQRCVPGPGGAGRAIRASTCWINNAGVMGTAAGAHPRWLRLQSSAPTNLGQFALTTARLPLAAGAAREPGGTVTSGASFSVRPSPSMT